MVGGLTPSGLPTLKVSVRHRPQFVTPTCRVAVIMPITGPIVPELVIRLVTVTVEVLGPVIMKLSKSSLSCIRK